MNLAAVRTRVDALLADQRYAAKRVEEERNALGQARTELAAIEEALNVAETIARAVQTRAHSRIAGLVSRCLGVVFDDPYTFEIEFERKRNKTEAKPVFLQDNHKLDPLEESSGGAADVAAFALRLAAIVMARPAPRKLIILDEPFKHVHSLDFRERLRQLLDELARELGVQIIMSTGIEELRTGKIIEVV